ncbi:Pepco domain-containing protein [Leptodesmis sp.]|uniref:Pepco domain-containing protein n=1 Tax=Leptodesmis sp. TaxID=3100501 RepID=UPI0040535680
MTDDVIYIVTEDRPEASPGEKGLLDRIGLKQVPVDPKKLEVEWNRMLRVVGKLLAQAEQQVGGESDLKLDEVTLAVEINSKGQVSLMGVGGAEASGKGAITLKFKRVESN